jgi:hypothetical protein
MADNFNHSDVNMICEMITKSLHPASDQTCRYYNKSRFQNNYSAIFKDFELKSDKDLLVVKGTFKPEANCFF